MSQNKRLAPKKLWLILLGALASSAAAAEDSAWVQIFNGKDMSDWDIKFQHHPLNENFRNTYKVVNGLLTVDYGAWPDFPSFGHAAYKVRPFTHYLLRSEYQVWGKQAPGGPGWAVENNGFMLHSQSMASMGLDQDFPISLEAQLLGPHNGSGSPNAKGTMNLCTPGTAFYTTPSGGSVVTSHCLSATANPRAPVDTGWERVSALVLADSLLQFRVDDKSVLEFYRPVYWKGNVSGDTLHAPANGTPLTGGYITIQAESAPYRFRKIEVLNLVGCMDKKSPAYRSYFVKNDPAACSATVLDAPGASASWGLSMEEDADGISLRGSQAGILELRALSGAILQRYPEAQSFQRHIRLPGRGVYLITWKTGRGTWIKKWGMP